MARLLQMKPSSVGEDKSLFRAIKFPLQFLRENGATAVLLSISAPNFAPDVFKMASLSHVCEVEKKVPVVGQ
jgi:hypothetical protein